MKRNFIPTCLCRICSMTSISIFLVFILILLLSAIAAERLTTAQHTHHQQTPQSYGMRYEEVTFPAREDGLTISAWYIPVDEESTKNTPAIVMVHGWNASRTVGFNQHFLDMAFELHNAGFALMMIDMRGHGESQAAHTSFGVYERRDVLAAIDELLARGHRAGRIGLLGTSMGAASVVGAAAEHPAVGAVVTDSMFADISPVIEGQWTEVSGMPILFLDLTLNTFKLMNGYDLEASKPIEEIEQIAPRPLMMIHCRQDSHVPLEQFQRLQAAAPWAETWLVDECRHAEIYEFVPQEYSQKVVSFFESGLAQQGIVQPDVEWEELVSNY